MSGWRGRHWPQEQQNANAPEGFGALAGDPAQAALVAARWAALLPPFDTGTEVPSPTDTR